MRSHVDASFNFGGVLVFEGLIFFAIKMVGRFLCFRGG